MFDTYLDIFYLYPELVVNNITRGKKWKALTVLWFPGDFLIVKPVMQAQ